MRYADTVILVFAKAPVAGEVNTRLIPSIGETAATQLQEDLIHDRISKLMTARLAPVILYCSPDTSHACFQSCRSEYLACLRPQTGRDLGERMTNAMIEQSAFFRNVVIIGTDAPALEMGRIDEAIDALHRHDVVMVPAEDGGYVLIATRIADHMIFDGVDWGTDRVAERTSSNCESARLDLHVTEPCWDIDTYEDYQRYLAIKGQG